MSEFDEIQATRHKRKAEGPCDVARAIAGLSKADQKEVDEYFGKAREEPGSYETWTFMRWFERRGIDLSNSRITAHKLRNCSCHRGVKRA